MAPWRHTHSAVAPFVVSVTVVAEFMAATLAPVQVLVAVCGTSVVATMLLIIVIAIAVAIVAQPHNLNVAIAAIVLLIALLHISVTVLLVALRHIPVSLVAMLGKCAAGGGNAQYKKS